MFSLLYFPTGCVSFNFISPHVPHNTTRGFLYDFLDYCVMSLLFRFAASRVWPARQRRESGALIKGFSMKQCGVLI